MNWNYFNTSSVDPHRSRTSEATGRHQANRQQQNRIFCLQSLEGATVSSTTAAPTATPRPTQLPTSPSYTRQPLPALRRVPNAWSTPLTASCISNSSSSITTKRLRVQPSYSQLILIGTLPIDSQHPVRPSDTVSNIQNSFTHLVVTNCVIYRWQSPNRLVISSSC